FGSTFGSSARNCCSVFDVLQGATLTGTGTSSLISLSSSTVTISDAQSGGNFFFVADTVSGFPSGELVSPSTVPLSGPLVSATGSTINSTEVLGVFGGASFTSSTTSPLVSLDSTNLKLATVTQGSTTTRGHFVDVGGQGSSNGTTFATMSLSGPLLSVS